MASAPSWVEHYLDLALVSFGSALMLLYHLTLLYRYLKYPDTTVIGFENHNIRAWVRRMFQVNVQDRGPMVGVITTNINAATALASICLVLSALMGALIGTSGANLFTSTYIYGNRSASTIYIKYIALLVFFLVAFACFVQSARYFVNANYLISMPNEDVPNDFVEKEVIRGSDFWHVGLRSLYFATTLLLWIFGPIPMITGSVITVAILIYLDRNTMPLHHYK